MRLYKISTNDVEVVPKYVGSKTEAANHRAHLVAAGTKRGDITTEEVDVPTTKAELIKFLNELEQRHHDNT